jgi:hypothetical protein
MALSLDTIDPCPKAIPPGPFPKDDNTDQDWVYVVQIVIAVLGCLTAAIFHVTGNPSIVETL